MGTAANTFSRDLAVPMQQRTGTAGSSIGTDLVVPMRQNRSVESIFRHTAKHSIYTPKKYMVSKNTTQWKVYQTSDRQLKSYGGATTMAPYSSRTASTISYSIGQPAKFNYSISRTPRAARARTRMGSNSGINIPGITTRMNVYVAGVSEEDGNGNYWDDDAEDWLPIPGGSTPNVGDKKEENGEWWYWNGTGWIPLSEVMPVGDAPYWLIALLLCIYIAVTYFRKRTAKHPQKM